MYVEGNIDPAFRPNNSLPEDDIIQLFKGGFKTTATPFSHPPITTTDAFQAFDDVLDNAGAGAALPNPRRDAVDERVVSEVRNGTGRIIDSISQVGGYPVHRSGTPYEDLDRDGMSDNWEDTHGLNHRNPGDGALVSANGYTNLETFLNFLAGDPVPGLEEPPPPVKPLPPPTNLRVE